MSNLDDIMKIPSYNPLKTDAASMWRKTTDRNKGVLVFYQSDICGWANELRDPQQWRPDYVAIDVSGSQWVTVGGDEASGSQEWCPIRVHH